MIPIEGLAEIAADYDGMLIDQFGVLHDGAKLYPGSLGVLAELHRLGIPVAVMTNSGRRAAPNVARLTQMGIPRAHFVDAVSSGEVAYDVLRGTAARRAFIIGRTGDEYGFDYFELVARPADADVILILGTNVPKTSLEDYGRLLSGITVPAICCNPDKLMITPTGLQPAPGAIAALYEAQGGKVRWIGKP
ncbi:MAG: TIGR01459 family HAD-type hydrolase, partial [Parvibaculaceae bacterium]